MIRIGKRKIPEVLSRATHRLLCDPLATWWARFVLSLWGAETGQNLRVYGHMKLWLLGGLTIGNEVRIRSGYSNYVGAADRTAIWVCPGGVVTIGDQCALSNITIVCRRSIRILEGTFIGGGSRLYDNDFHQIEPANRAAGEGDVQSAPITIGPQTFIGAHSTVLKGVTVGEGAVIGAGSIVTGDVPRFEIWAGVPARKIGAVPQCRENSTCAAL